MTTHLPVRGPRASMGTKQAIVARTDIGMGQGKLAAQVAHASLSAYEDADDRTRREWKGGGQKKIVLKAAGESELFDLADRAEREGLPNAIVRDAGHTQLEPGTVTALAVGPGPENIVDKVTGDLSLF
jgi:PTH2 family peptidyl-tRNA hydrolase